MLARKSVLTLHYIVFIPGLIAGFVVSSAVCVGGSLCLKLKNTYVELELRSTKSEHFETENVVCRPSRYSGMIKEITSKKNLMNGKQNISILRIKWRKIYRGSHC